MPLFELLLSALLACRDWPVFTVIRGRTAQSMVRPHCGLALFMMHTEPSDTALCLWLTSDQTEAGT